MGVAQTIGELNTCISWKVQDVELGERGREVSESHSGLRRHRPSFQHTLFPSPSSKLKLVLVHSPPFVNHQRPPDDFEPHRISQLATHHSSLATRVSTSKPKPKLSEFPWPCAVSDFNFPHAYSTSAYPRTHMPSIQVQQAQK